MISVRPVLCEKTLQANIFSIISSGNFIVVSYNGYIYAKSKNHFLYKKNQIWPVHFVPSWKWMDYIIILCSGISMISKLIFDSLFFSGLYFKMHFYYVPSFFKQKIKFVFTCPLVLESAYDWNCVNLAIGLLSNVWKKVPSDIIPDYLRPLLT